MTIETGRKLNHSKGWENSFRPDILQQQPLFCSVAQGCNTCRASWRQQPIQTGQRRGPLRRACPAETRGFLSPPSRGVRTQKIFLRGSGKWTVGSACVVGILRRGCEGGKEIPGRAGHLAVGGWRLRSSASIITGGGCITRPAAGELLQRDSRNAL